MTTYRQIAHKLRINRGPGRPDKVSIRPRAGSRERGWAGFTDTDDAPTLIEFDEFDQVDIPALVRSGAIQPYTPPAAPGRGGRRGETTG